MKKNKKTWFFSKKIIILNNKWKLLFKIKIMNTLKPQAVKLRGETTEKLKDLKIEIAWVELNTYDDKINHLIWFYNEYNKKHKKEIENSLL